MNSSAIGPVIPEGQSDDCSRVGVPYQSYPGLFGRFFRFGCLAWGGPVAQIAMIRRELVENERWISSARFNRVYALYQVLPGPEAHELCVYFGMLARGRLGGTLAGIAFMLPGFVLMFLLSWLYAAHGGKSAAMAAIFYGTQPAIAAAVVRAVHRIGKPVLSDRWLWSAAFATAVAQSASVPFYISLALSGVAYVAARRGRPAVALAILAALVIIAAIAILGDGTARLTAVRMDGGTSGNGQQSLLELLGSGLRAGLLTFGGAYTAIPFLQHDAVVRGAWMTNDQFLDGLALSGILPAPLIIFATFVGYLGRGAFGAMALTFGVFLPAFGFTLIAHEWLERAIARPGLHDILAGITAGVIGLIAVTGVVLARAAVTDVETLAIALTSLAVLYLWNSKFSILAVVVGSASVGWLLAIAR